VTSPTFLGRWADRAVTVSCHICPKGAQCHVFHRGFVVASRLLVKVLMDARSLDPRRIMIVDDDDCVREAMEMSLTGAGHQVRSTASGEEALAWLDAEPCDLLIIDYNMPEIDGATLYRRVLKRWPVAGPRILICFGLRGVRG
jgi:PleD family two-component response regulator